MCISRTHTHARTHVLLIYFIKMVLMVVVLVVGSGCVMLSFYKLKVNRLAEAGGRVGLSKGFRTGRVSMANASNILRRRTVFHG